MEERESWYIKKNTDSRDENETKSLGKFFDKEEGLQISIPNWKLITPFLCTPPPTIPFRKGEVSWPRVNSRKIVGCETAQMQDERKETSPLPVGGINYGAEVDSIRRPRGRVS